MDPVSLLAATPYVGWLVPWVAAAIAICAVAARFMPPPADDASRWYRVAYRWVNQIAQNAGHAKNAQ